MSLQVLAQDMASRGRGPDTMLVHMAPREVAGLQALAKAHGGSLTVNPQTGLPEAGFLSSLLPTIAGIGLSIASGGTLTPLMAAGIVGGGTALATGNLRKGLMAGLGAYGGAGIGSVVGGAGAAATAAAPSALDAGMNVLPSTGNIGMTGLDAGIGAYPSTGAIGAPVGLDAGMGTYDVSGFKAAPQLSPEVERLVNTYPAPAAATSPAVSVTPPAAIAAPADMPPPPPQISSYAATNLQPPGMLDTTKAGLKAIYEDPSKLFNKENLKYGAAALAPMMFQTPKSVQAPRDTEQYRYAYNPNREMPPTRAGDVGEFTYFRPSYTRLAADGGLMDLPVERMSDRNEAETLMANGGQMYAAGGISHLGDYSDGGRLLRGPGDGVSDSIPASIADKRPARLADGEFVVPARIVSELGNGSTDAGARKLYAMMDRVQKNRGKTVGKGKVAVDSGSEKLLPA